MVASVGYKGSFAGDASKPFVFRSQEWTRVLSRKEKRNKIKPMVEEENFEIIPEKKVLEDEVVSFEVAPEGNNLATHQRQVMTAGKISQHNKKKAPKKGKQLSKKAFEKILEEVKCQDKKFEEVNKTIAVTVKMLEEQLTKGIKIAKLQRELHEIIRNFEMHRLKTVFPLRTVNFEQNFEVISENIDEIGELYEQLDKKCNDWKERFKEHDIGYYTFSPRNDTVERDDRCLYVDPFGHADFTVPDESNDYYEPCPINIRRPSNHHRCQFIGHHRHCSPMKKQNSPRNVSYILQESNKNNQNWKKQFHQELQEVTHTGLHSPKVPHEFQVHDFKMKAKASKVNQEPKAKLVSHGNQQVDDMETHHRTACQRSEEIFNATWKEKEELRAKRQQQHVPFTRIERAFVAIRMSTEGEIEHDEEKAKTAAIELKSEMEKADLQDLMTAQQSQIAALTRELEELRKKDRQFCTPSVTSHHSDPVAEPPIVIHTSSITQDIPSTTPASGEISYTTSVMLERYER
jgi:hypothetical protein